MITKEEALVRLDEIESQCAREFYNLPDEDGDFDEAWKIYTENVLLGLNEGYDDIESISNFDFIDWVTC